MKTHSPFIAMPIAILLLSDILITNAQFFEYPSKTNFYVIRDSLLKVFGEIPRPDTTAGWDEGGMRADFRKWESYWGERLYPTGDFNIYLQAMDDFLQSGSFKQQQSQSLLATANWTCLGPFNTPSGTIGARGTGLMMGIDFHPSDQNTKYVCGYGGVWKTTDNCTTWVNAHTDKGLYPQIYVSDILVNPSNTNMLFAATGDADQGRFPSFGVFRSTDGGTTDAGWENISSGLPAFNAQQFYFLRKLTMHPTNPDIIYAATSMGIFVTNNNATTPTPTWLEITDSDIKNKYFRNILFKPNDPQTIYAAGKETFISTDGGMGWANLNMPLPNLTCTLGGCTADVCEVYRINIAVTPAAPNKLYAYIYATDCPQKYYFKVYDGTTWNDKPDVPVSTAYKNRGFLPVIVSSTNENEIYVGNTTVRRYNNLTNQWDDISPYGGVVHADIHDLRLQQEGGINKLYAATDGGIYRTTVNAANATISTWETINNGLAVSTMYRLGGNATDPDRILTGHQDDGTNMYYPPTLPPGNPWQIIGGGDGFECIYDYANPGYYLSGMSNHGIVKQSATFSGFIGPPKICCDQNGQNCEVCSDYSAPTILDPTNPDIIYTENWGLAKGKWNGINYGWYGISSDFDWNTAPGCTTAVVGSNRVKFIAIAPSNNKYIYASTLPSYAHIDGYNPCEPAVQLFKTTVGGYNTFTEYCQTNCWAEITPPNIPTCSGYYCLPQITGIAVNYSYPNIIYVSFSGYYPDYKVWMYDGTTWQNYSTGIDNFPVNTIVHQEGTMDALYVGTDMGVYYRDISMSQWEPFSDGLPNVSVYELEINYCGSKIRAATWGRGLWESDLVPPTSVSYTIGGPTQWENTTKMIAGDLTLNGDLTVKNSVIRFAKPLVWKIIVNSGTTLIIDDSYITFCNGKWYDMEIKSGGTAIFRNRSKLKVENGSEIVIHRGGKLIIESDAELVYNNQTDGKGIIFDPTPSGSAEPYVEIKGTGKLRIADNTEFKIEYSSNGDGYLRFDPAYNCCIVSGNPYCAWECPNSIKCGTNASFTLIGNGHDDKIIEIVKNTVGDDQFEPQSMFTIKNGKVVMDHVSSRLNVAAPIQFINSKVTGVVGHRGLAIYGNSNTNITNSVFEYGNPGLAANLFWGNSLNLTGNTFQYNIIGLYSYDKSIDVNACVFYQNGIGWKAEEMTLPCSAEEITATLNEYGTYFSTTSYGSLYLSSSQLLTNGEGVVYDGTGRLTISCSHISENGDGIVVANGAELNMSKDITPVGGTVNASENWLTAITTILDNNTTCANALYLNNGGNNFSYDPADVTPPGYLFINGKINTASCYGQQLQATRNQWFVGNGNDPLIANSPQYNYFLKPCMWCPPKTGMIGINDMPRLAYSGYYCPAQQMTGPNNPNAAMSTPLDFCPNCPQITTASFTKVKLNDAVKQTMAKMELADATGGNDLTAVQMFYEILTYKLKQKHERFEWLNNLAYSSMKMAFSNAFRNGKIQPSPTPATAVQQIITVQDTILARAAISGDNFKTVWVTYDKSQTYRLNEEYSKTLQTLANLSICTPLDSSQTVFLSRAYDLAYMDYLAFNGELPPTGHLAMILDSNRSTAFSRSGINISGQFHSGDTLFTCIGDTLVFRPSRFANYYYWNFGNGQTSTDATPSTIYTADGFYTVTLIETFTCGSDTFTTTIAVGPPIAHFTASNSQNIPLTVDFTNTTNPLNGVTYRWDFGDGLSDTLMNPSHTYIAAGTYTVCLTAKNSCGNNTYCSDVTVAKTYQITLGTPSYESNAYCLPLPDGSIIVSGSTYYNDSNLYDMTLIHLDDSLHISFSNTYGGTADDVASDNMSLQAVSSFSRAADGGFILTGTTSSFGAGSFDAFLLRTNSAGVLQWSKTFGDSLNNYGTSVVETSDGGFLIAGGTESSAGDIYLVKIDINGTMLWTKIIGGAGIDANYAMQKTADGAILLAGTTTSFGAGAADGYLCKIDTSGNIIWFRTYGSSSVDAFSSVIALPDCYVVSGITNSISGNEDGWLLKTDLSGNVIWSKAYNAGSADRFRHVTAATDNGFAAVGRTAIIGFGSYDVFLLKTDSMGNPEFSKIFGGTGNDQASTVYQLKDRGYLVCGFTNSFGQGYDFYLIKTDENGASGCNEMDVTPLSYSFTPASNFVTPAILSGGIETTPAAQSSSAPFTVANQCSQFSAKKGNEDVNETGNTESDMFFNTVLSGQIIDQSSVPPSSQTANSIIDQPVISVYPNPSTGELNIIYSLSGNEKAEFSVYDLIGKKLLKYELPADKTVYTISNLKLENGIYFYGVSVERERVATGRIVLIK